MFTVRVSRRATRREENSLTGAASNEVIIDSGASEHVVGNIQLLTDVKMLPNIYVEHPGGQRVDTIQKGKFSLLLGSDYVTLTSMYYIPCMNINIISCTRLDEKRFTTTITNGVCHLRDRRNGVTFGRLNKMQSDGLFVTIIRTCQAHEETRGSVGLDDNKAHPK